jgi:hypothetical protein
MIFCGIALLVSGAVASTGTNQFTGASQYILDVHEGIPCPEHAFQSADGFPVSVALIVIDEIPHLLIEATETAIIPLVGGLEDLMCGDVAYVISRGVVIPSMDVMFDQLFNVMSNRPDDWLDASTLVSGLVSGMSLPVWLSTTPLSVPETALLLRTHIGVSGARGCSGVIHAEKNVAIHVQSRHDSTTITLSNGPLLLRFTLPDSAMQNWATCGNILTALSKISNDLRIPGDLPVDRFLQNLNNGPLSAAPTGASERPSCGANAHGIEFLQMSNEFTIHCRIVESNNVEFGWKFHDIAPSNRPGFVTNSRQNILDLSCKTMFGWRETFLKHLYGANRAIEYILTPEWIVR